MTYNLKSIMTTAWAYFKANRRHVSFACALKRAWAIAKYMAAKARAIQAKIDELDKRIFSLAMKDMWSQGDYDLDRRLHAERYGLMNEIQAA
jgi:hypothetical protein